MRFYKGAYIVLATVLVSMVHMVGTPRLAMAETDRVERLIQDAISASGSQRLQAVEALGHSGDLRALQPLLGLLHDVDPSIREQASKALRTLVQSLRHLSTHLAQWIDSLLLRLDIYLAPELPIEQTKVQRTI
jgi:HEAT repeat protein